MVRVSEARTKFLAACDAAYIPVQAVAGRATGSEDDRRTVYADLARFGSPSAERLLVLAPAEGGNSAFVSAGILTALVQEKLYRFLPRNVALATLHAINPKGPLWPATFPSPDEGKAAEDAVEENGSSEARYESQPGPRPFNRNQLAELPMASLIQPAWDMPSLEKICLLAKGESRDIRLLELADMPGLPGNGILATRTPGNWPAFGEDPISDEIPTSPLGMRFENLEGCDRCCHAQLRLSLHEGYRPPSDKNKDRFLPDKTTGWHQPLWESTSNYLRKVIESLGDGNLTSED